MYLQGVKVDDRVGVEGGDVAALAPRIRRRPLRVGRILHRRRRVSPVRVLPPQQSAEQEQLARGTGGT
jgi:hypothetical protein